jgi:hypothetical protein
MNVFFTNPHGDLTMKSLYAMATVALMCFNALSANELEEKTDVSLVSETLSLSELLSYVEDTVQQLIDADDDETCQLAYHELKESLKIVYTLNCFHRQEAATILQVLDECYADLTDAIDTNPDKANILEQSLSLFTSGRNYDHETLGAQPLSEWTDAAPSNEMKSTIETANADLVYIQDSVLWSAKEDMPRASVHPRSRLFYQTQHSQHTTPQILIVKNKSNSSAEYEVQGEIKMKLGGKDHGKVSGHIKGGVRDNKGNYAGAKISKEQGDDGYECGVEGGKKKEIR